MSGRWGKVLLAVSLVLNLFVIGAVAGVLIMRQQLLARAASSDPVMRAADALPSPQREAFRAMIGVQIQALRPGLRDARLARRNAMARLQTEPFDRAGAGADLARARMDDQNARAAVEEAILNFAAQLPPDQRAAFGKGLVRAGRARWIASHPGYKQTSASKP
jgi:uncharacterized membrane protein